MDTFIFQASLWCSDCGEAIRARMIEVGAALADDGDSDALPQGPYANGGGEADTPQHCDSCGTFLDNPLTGDGETYVRDAFREFVETGRGHVDTLETWKDAYHWIWEDFADITFADMVEDGEVSDLMQRRFDDLGNR